MEKKLTTSESILLNFGDLSLSSPGDIFYFSKSIKVNNFDYEDLIHTNDCIKSIGYGVVSGDGRGAVKISTKDKEPIYYLFGANRYTSNASNIAIGYQNNDTSFIFLRECFADIYSKKPRLTARDIITVDSIWSSDEKKFKRIYDCICNKSITILPEDIKLFKDILVQISGYETAFSAENFKQLVLKKR